jgi:hypothetical protein
MTLPNRSKFAHKHHPVFAVAKEIYRSLHVIKCLPSAAAKGRQLDRVATQLLSYLAEAIDLPWLRAPRLAGAQSCLSRLDAVLEALLLDAAIEPSILERASDELSAFSDALEDFARATPMEVRQSLSAKPEPGAEGDQVAADTRDTAPELASQESPPESDGSSDGPGSHPQPENGSLDAGAESDRDPCEQVALEVDPTKLTPS